MGTFGVQRLATFATLYASVATIVVEIAAAVGRLAIFREVGDGDRNRVSG